MIPTATAAALSAVVAFLEVRTVGRAWGACDVGVNASANGLTLLFFHLPVLWFVQTASVAGISPALTLLSRNRVVVTVVMGAVAGVVLVFAAWAYFALAGLPITGQECDSVQPDWWPGWLPPRPHPFY